MPELPEVEMYRREIREKVRKSVIKNVQIPDAYVVKLPEKAFKNFLKGKKVKDLIRKGKYLFWEFEDGGGMLMHFGLTGKPGWCMDENDCPKNSRVLFEFDQFIFAYVDPRKFGKLDVGEDINELINRYAPAPDALDISSGGFVKALEGRDTPVKAALLEQSRFMGIGNWLADEILFQSKIFPGTRLVDLEKKDMQSMYRSMQKVLKKAVELDADWDRFPQWFFVKERGKSGHCPRDGSPLKRADIAGRTTFYCKKCQPEG